MHSNPWLSIFVGVAILLAVLSLDRFGDGLRDALDACYTPLCLKSDMPKIVDKGRYHA